MLGERLCILLTVDLPSAARNRCGRNEKWKGGTNYKAYSGHICPICAQSVVLLKYACV